MNHVLTKNKNGINRTLFCLYGHGITPIDIMAAVCFIALAILYCYYVRIGFPISDESYYFTMPHRVILGEKLFSDEWHIIQMTSFILYLPLKVFYSVVGSMDGVVLYFRYLYVVIKMIFFIYIYVSLRRYGVFSLIASLAFTLYNCMRFVTLSYYNMAPMALVLVGILLFVKREPRVIDIIFAGFVFACCVICEPETAIIYFLYSIAVLITGIVKRNKGKDFSFSFILDRKSFLYITVGISVCALLFLIAGFALFFGTDFSRLINDIPEMFNDSEYVYPTLLEKLRLIPKGSVYCEHTGFIQLYINLSLIISMIALRKHNGKKSAGKISTIAYPVSLFITAAVFLFFIIVTKAELLNPLVTVSFGLFFFFLLKVVGLFFLKDINDDVIRKILFIVYTSAFLITTASILFRIDVAQDNTMKPVNVAVYGLFWYYLQKEKDHRMFCFWLLGMLFTAAKDHTSQASIGPGCIIAVVPAVILFAEAFEQIRFDYELSALKISISHKKINVSALIFSLFFIGAVGGDIYYSAQFFDYNYVEDYCFKDEPAGSAVLDIGPLKGIVTNDSLKSSYDRILHDIDKIKSSDGTVCVVSRQPWIYLYCDAPYPTYSSYFVANDFVERNKAWLDKHPDRYPDYYYIPFFDSTGTLYLEKIDTAYERVELVKQLCSFSLERGEGGLLLKVEK